MPLIVTVLAFALLVLWRAADTAIGRWLHRHVVARLAANLDRVARRRMLVALLVASTVLGAMWLGRDALNVLALASPDLILLLGSVETSLYIDAALTAVLTWSTVRTIPAWKTGMRDRIRRSTPRERRTTRIDRRASNDDEEGERRRLRVA